MKSFEKGLAMLMAITLVFSIISALSFSSSRMAFAADGDERDHEDIEEPLGENSEVKLDLEDGSVDIEIKIEDGDLEDGDYSIDFSCTSPSVNRVFESALEVEDGEGEAEVEVLLDDGTYSGCEVTIDDDLSAEFSAFIISQEENDDDEDEREQRDDDEEENSQDGKKDDNKDELEESIGENSKVKLDVEDNGVEIEIEIEDGDLSDGTYDINFVCSISDINKEFENALEVEDGEGESELYVALESGTYSGCEVAAGSLSTEFSAFAIMLEEDDDNEKEREEKGNERDDENEDEHKEKKGDSEIKSELEVEGDTVEIEIRARNLNLTEGSYDAFFTCTDPSITLNFTNAFEVEDGKGKFETEFGLDENTYDGCHVMVHDEGHDDIVLASFRAFDIRADREDDIEEKREERKRSLISNISAKEIHKRHLNASPEHLPGANYTLTANGTAAEGNSTSEVELEIEMAIWKSTRSLLLLDLTDGTILVDGKTYNVALGYAFYLIKHDSIHVKALVVSEDDPTDILRMRLHGSAVNDDAEFPSAPGESIEIEFPGAMGPSRNHLGDWRMTLEADLED